MLVYTTRTMMRPFSKSDLQQLTALCTNEDAMRYIPPTFGIENAQQIEERLSNYINHHDEFGVGFCYVSDKAGNFIGRAGFHFVPEVNLYEIGYSLLPEHWGKGLATEVVSALLEYAYNDLKLDAVCARTIVGNDRSDKVLQKCGFTLLGERAFVVGEKLCFWNYYEHNNEDALVGHEAYMNVHEEDWNILI